MTAPVHTALDDLDDLRALLPDWRRHLRAANKAPATIASYLRVAEAFVDFLVVHGMPTRASTVSREHVEHYLADMTDRVKPATVARHYRSLQQLFRWLSEVEGEIARSPMEKMRPPAVPEQPVPILSDQEITALLKAADGKTFENRRDTAIIRVLIDSGMRVGELVGIALG